MATIPELRDDLTDIRVPDRGIEEPLAAPDLFVRKLHRFPEELYNLHQDSHLYRFLLALCGEGGAGSVKKETLYSKLQSSLASTHFHDLDKLYGDPLALPRISSEIYTFDPRNDTLTVNEWIEIYAKDASYRNRCLLWMRAIIYGGSVMGMRLAAEAACGVECDIFAVADYLDDTRSDHPKGISNLGQTTSDGEFVIVPRINSLTNQEKHRIIAMVDRVRPVDTLVTISLGTTIRTQKNATSVEATSDFSTVLRLVTGRVDVKWPDVGGPASENLIVNGSFEGLTTPWLTTSGGFLNAGGTLTAEAPSGTATKPVFGSWHGKVVTAGGTTHEGARYPTLLVQIGMSYTFSVFVRSSAVMNIDICVGSSTVGQTVTATTSDSDWSRIWVSFTATSTGFAECAVRTTGTTVGTFYLDGAQFEQMPNPTPYIPTLGTTTRKRATTPSNGRWIEAGVEKEAPTYAWMGRQEAATFLDISSVDASSLHYGDFSPDQKDLFAHLKTGTDDQFYPYSPDYAFTEAFSQIGLSIPWQRNDQVLVNNYYPLEYLQTVDLTQFNVSPTHRFWASNENTAIAPFDIRGETYASTITTQTPYLYFKLDETSGTIANDSSGNGHTGTYVMNVDGLGRPGLTTAPEGKSVFFNGNRVTTTGTTVPVAPFAIEAWVTVDAGSIGNARRFANHGVAVTDGWAVGINASGKWRFSTHGVHDYDFSAVATVVEGSTYFVRFVYKADFSVELFINGVSQGSLTNGVGMVATTDTFRLGSRSDNTEPWLGRIDEAVYYAGDPGSTHSSTLYTQGSTPDPSYDNRPSTEYLKFDLGRARPINYIEFEISAKPITIQVETSTDGYNFTEVAPAALSDHTSEISYVVSDQPWRFFRLHFDTRTARYVRLTFTRRDDPFPFASTTPFRWSIDVRNFRAIFLMQNSGDYEQDFGTDILGNAWRTDIQTFDPALTMDGQATTFWVSQPNPTPQAVEALYYDVSSTTHAVTMGELDSGLGGGGNTMGVYDNISMASMEAYVTGAGAQTVDEIFIDPVFSGSDMHFYWSVDENPDWESKLWHPVPRHYKCTRGYHALPYPVICRFFKVEFSNLTPIPYNTLDYPQLLPPLYRKFPTWVQNYFAALTPEIFNQLLNEGEVVTIDPYDMFKIQTDALATTLDQDLLVREEPPVDNPNEISEIADEVVNLGDETIQIGQETRIKFFPPTFWRDDLKDILDLSRAASRLIWQDEEEQFMIETTPEILDAPVEQSVEDLSDEVVNKKLPIMWFPRVCRHGYQVVTGPFQSKVAYQVAIREISFWYRGYSFDTNSEFGVSTYGESFYG